MSSRIQFTTHVEIAESLVDRLPINGLLAASEPLVIPEHQREYCWTEKKQHRFIYVLLQGRPVPQILLRKHQNGTITLEDGRQRLTTLQLFKNDEIRDRRGKLYSELTADERSAINNYKFSVTQYRGATDQEAIEIFDDHQNGIILSVGERLHGLASLSPIIRFVKATLLTCGSGLHDRAALVWGVRGNRDRRRNYLTKMYALCAGIAFGPEYTTKKWEEIQHGPTRDTDGILSREFDTAAVTMKLEAILTIFEQAQLIEPVSKKRLNKQFDPGFLTAYITYSFNIRPTEIFALTTRWIEFIVDARRNPSLLKTVLHKDIAATRSWNNVRWQKGYLRVFDPTNSICVEADRQQSLVTTDSEDTDDE